MDDSPFIFELAASGPGPALRERLTDAIADLRPDAGVEFIAVVVRLVPVTDGRPAAVCIRRALKRLLRRDGLSASWTLSREPLAERADGEVVTGRPAPAKRRKTPERSTGRLKTAKCEEIEVQHA